jgi:hypothetical protein
MTRRLVAACLCTGAVFWTSTADAAGYAPQVGQPHPDFTLPSLADRAAVSLSEFRGRKVLLIHFSSW